MVASIAAAAAADSEKPDAKETSASASNQQQSLPSSSKQATGDVDPPRAPGVEQNLSPPVVMDEYAKKAFASARPRLILALGGGGCKAVAQIGVLRSFESHHIPIDGIVGTSMGATIGALYCSGVSVDDIEKMFMDKSIQRAITPRLLLHTVARPLTILTDKARGRSYAGICSGDRLLRLLQQKLPPSFENLQKPFAAVATNLNDGQSCVLGHGDLPRSVLASNALSPVFRPVMIEGKLYTDGGVRANLPVLIAKQLGGSVVAAVLVDTALTHKDNVRFKSMKAVVARVADIMLAAADSKQARDSDTLLYPDIDRVPLCTTNTTLLKQAIASGEKAADKMTPSILKELRAATVDTRDIRTQLSPRSAAIVSLAHNSQARTNHRHPQVAILPSSVQVVRTTPPCVSVSIQESSARKRI
jgi:NTE family protein